MIAVLVLALFASTVFLFSGLGLFTHSDVIADFFLMQATTAS